MKKTSRGLVEYAKSMIGMPYVRGTYGKIGNRDMLELKRRQYSEQFINDYDYILENWEFFNNKPWHDAPGLIKGYYWQNERGSINWMPGPTSAQEDYIAHQIKKVRYLKCRICPGYWYIIPVI